MVLLGHECKVDYLSSSKDCEVTCFATNLMVAVLFAVIFGDVPLLLTPRLKSTYVMYFISLAARYGTQLALTPLVLH